MTDVGFYHLTRTALEEALPRLLGRTLDAGQRALVLCPNDGRVATLDKALWQAKQPDWLPHGTQADGDADLQPIWLSAETSAPNGAKYLFLVDSAETDDLGRFDRVFDLFDGKDDDAVAAARRRWTAAKAAGHALTYWQQEARGWVKKA